MTTLVVVLFGIMLISVAVSAVLYARQQAAQHKAAKIKALLQRCQEYESARSLILRIDDRPDISIAMTGAVIELHKELVSLGLSASMPKLEEMKQQLMALKEGRLTPLNARVMQNDRQMNTSLEGLRTLGNKLMRLKLRGDLSTEIYQRQVDHLEYLKMNLQVRSHEHFAEQFLQEDKRREAVAHLKKAREVYKRSNLAAETKNEAVRRLSDQIKAAETVALDSPSGTVGTETLKDSGDDEELDLA